MTIKNILKNKEKYTELLSRKGFDLNLYIDSMEKNQKKIDQLTIKIDSLRNKININSKMIKENKGDKNALVSEVKQVKIELPKLQDDVNKAIATINEILLKIPNAPRDSVVVGKNEKDNKVIKVVKGIKATNKKNHWDILKDNDMVDFDRGVKLSGSRFVIYKNKGSELLEALKYFMLNSHTTNYGYIQYSTPFIVKSQILMGTGQLPKFKDDLYKTDDDLWLIPTAEVSLTSMFSNEMMSYKDFPINITGYSPSFRKEAGAAGKDTKGIIRLHQFNKVELVNIVSPEDDQKELDKMLKASTSILDELKLPYRIIELCTGEMTFSSSITYDIEVWMPGRGEYVEVSSVSSCSDFQSTRMNLRYKNEDGKKIIPFTHNGSGLAIDRVIAAIVENYCNTDGKIAIPDVLKKFFNNSELF